MLWTIFGISLAVIGLITATTLWSRLQEKRRRIVLAILLVGIIVVNVESHFEATKNEEITESLRDKLHTAEQKIIENELLREKLVEYDEIARLNADGSTGLVKKGGGLSGGDSAITPKAQKIWIYAGENNDVRHPKCDKDGMEQAKTITIDHPKFPFSHYMLAACQKRDDDQEWILSAQRALDILEFTTQVPGHNNHHDVAKQRLRKWMKETDSIR